MAGTFPSTIQAPEYPFGEKFIKRKIFSKFESGHELTRTTATVGKHAWTLKWSHLPEAQYQTLKTFFDTQGSETFSWTHPITSTTYTVRFVEPELEGEIPFHGYRRVTLMLHEVP